MKRDITVELAGKNSLHKIVKILDGVTENLLEKGIDQWEYPWDEKVIIKDLLSNRVFVVNYKEQPIATFSIKDINDCDNPYYKNMRGKYLYRLAVLPSVQGLGLGGEILAYIREDYDFTHNDLYLDCWNGNDKLKEFYLRAGFRYVGDFPEDDYYISVFKINEFATIK